MRNYIINHKGEVAEMTDELVNLTRQSGLYEEDYHPEHNCLLFWRKSDSNNDG